ncbi:beta-galactosidase [Frondihabitans sucicola]|uniref:beta-galactosidase n=1 Tax=Frondihabitans sucicola TaxID=1268041 RepID=UPI002573F2BE|nr:beta-galactosidase trimerization domain-containing protein [Frondihabitans sucicola]
MTVDFTTPTSDLSPYRAVIVPELIAASDEQLEALDAYVALGGTLVATFQTAITDENLHVRLGGYLGTLRETLGLWVEEFAPPAAPDLAAAGGRTPPPLGLRGDSIGGTGAAVLWGEYLRLESAEATAWFDGGVLDGQPAITRNDRGAGTAWYVATQPDDDTLLRFVETVLSTLEVERLPRVPGVEFVRRGSHLVAINHGPERVALELTGTDVLTGADASGLVLESQGVAVVARVQAGAVRS